MQVNELINQLGGIKSLARELGVDESTATAGMAALLPAVLGGFKKQAAGQSSGVDGLVSMLGSLGGGGLMDDVLGAKPTNVSRGNDVLGQILGSKDVSRSVAQNASAQTGIDPSMLKKMLPMIAMLVGGYLAKQGGAARSAQSPQAGSGLGGLLGSLAEGRGGQSGQSGLGGLAAMLDLNKDGNPLDDILKLAAKRLG